MKFQRRQFLNSFMSKKTGWLDMFGRLVHIYNSLVRNLVTVMRSFPHSRDLFIYTFNTDFFLKCFCCFINVVFHLCLLFLFFFVGHMMKNILLRWWLMQIKVYIPTWDYFMSIFRHFQSLSWHVFPLTSENIYINK